MPDDAGADFQFMTAVPLPAAKLSHRLEFELICLSGPTVEGVAAQPFGGHEQVEAALSISIAVKARIPERRVEGAEAELIGGAHGHEGPFRS